MQVSENSPEPWVAMGYYCMATRKGTRAVYFAQKVQISKYTVLLRQVRYSYGLVTNYYFNIIIVIYVSGPQL